MAELRRGKRRTGLRILIVLVLLFAVVFVIADRIALGVAERRMAEVITDEARKSNAQSGSTAVDINGFPFLSQVAAGQFDGGRVVLRNVRTPQLTVGSIDVDLTDLRVPRDVLLGAPPHDVIARQIRGTATVALTEVAAGIARQGVQGLQGLRLAGDNGAVRFSGTLPLGGSPVPVSGAANVRLEGDRVWLKVLEIKAAGVEVPRAVLALVTNQFTTGVTLPPLPLGLKLTNIRVDGGQVRVSAVADGVNLAQ